MAKADKKAAAPSDMMVVDIQTEQFREYLFSDGTVYRIVKPTTLWVKKSDGGDSHRVLDAEGITHYIPSGWRVIRWSAPDAPVTF